MSGKRGAATELTKDNWNQDDGDTSADPLEDLSPGERQSLFS